MIKLDHGLLAQMWSAHTIWVQGVGERNLVGNVKFFELRSARVAASEIRSRRQLYALAQILSGDDPYFVAWLVWIWASAA
jgi:hypothetical protein